LNGQIANQIIIRNTRDLGDYRCTSYDCKGQAVEEKTMAFSKGVLEIPVPPCGILKAKKDNTHL